ncbi:HlyD family efflux transporter periplasmic adaptor subunit [Candidatus Falkowbacteria bacterium]|nr:HlyD family efflux transporter periplasmic adaptor subunit [Candidatus Falkowbacteria bacterium]
MKKAKKRLLYFGLPILAIIIIVVLISSKKPAPVYTTVTATYGPLTQTVSETGTIKPIEEISLDFLSVGKIESVAVKVGDEVKAGQVLASLDSSSLVLRRQEAVAALSIAQANYSKTSSGASFETVSVAKRSLEQAQSAEASARLDLEKTIKTVNENIRQAEKTYADLIAANPSSMPAARQAVLTAETSLSNSEKTYLKTIDNSKGSLVLVLSDKLLTVRVAMDNINKIFEDDDVKNILSVKNSTYKSQTENAKNRIIDSLPAFETLLLKARTSETKADLIPAAESLASILFNSSAALDLSYLMLENTITSSSFSQAELDAYKSLIISQSAQISAASSALEGATQAYKNAYLNYETGMAAAQSSLDQAKSSLSNAILAAQNNVSNVKLSAEQQHLAAAARLENAIKNVSLAQAQYNNTVAPARSQDLQLVNAQISQAQAALENIDKQISDANLVATMDGIITEVNFKAGEQFSGGALAMVKMLVDNSFEVEVDISESNISKVKVGNPVAITLDAFSDDLTLEGTVSFIEPAQTLIAGVVYYKVKIIFSDLEKTSALLEARGLSLKSGMTANTVITTDSKDNVLSVPSRAIIEKEGKKIVRVLRGDVYDEVKIEEGLRGDNGLTEIQGVINTDDLIITFIKENGK